MQDIITSLSSEAFSELISEAVRQELHNLQQTPQKETEEPVKIDEIAKMLQVSHVTIHQWKRAGKIPYHKMGKQTFFYKSEVLDSLKKYHLKSNSTYTK